MRTGEILNAIASWLESPNNEALWLAEDNEDCMKIVAESCILAAALIKNAAEQIDSMNPVSTELKYKWTVYNKLESGLKEGQSKIIAEFEGSFDEGNEIMKDLSKPGSIFSGRFGEDGGHLIYRSDDDSFFIEAVAEPITKITPESIEDLANLATAFDASGDPALKKQASVIDELLLTIASPPGALAAKKAAEDYRLEELKKKYEQPRKELHDNNKIADSEKAIEKSEMTKNYKILEAPLSARTCPDHAGAQMARVGEHMFQCEMDKKVYNYESGYTLNSGAKVPGGDVAQQTIGIYTPSYSIFDSRQERLGQNKP